MWSDGNVSLWAENGETYGRSIKIEKAWGLRRKKWGMTMRGRQILEKKPSKGTGASLGVLELEFAVQSLKMY